MTDYVKSTNFTSKDSLASGNPLKIIKGTEFDIEFNNLAVAISTKADIASPAFLGTPTAPTAVAGTNTTQVATTAFVVASLPATLQAVYPVGSIYINAGVTTNPATLLGFGTWTAFGAGRVMVGLNGSDALFDALEETGGSKDAITVSHAHTFSGTTAGAGNHNHSVTIPVDGSSSPLGVGLMSTALLGPGITASYTTSSIGDHSHTYSGTTASEGSSGTNANIQPYITVAMWKRTA